MAKKKAAKKTGKQPSRRKSTVTKASVNREASARRSDTASSQPSGSLASSVATHRWTFLTNHSHVLVLLDSDEAPVLREVAIQVGITERAVQRIIQDLEAGGFIERERIGRRNCYRVLRDQRLRHPIESHRTIGDLLKLVSSEIRKT